MRSTIRTAHRTLRASVWFLALAYAVMFAFVGCALERLDHEVLHPPAAARAMNKQAAVDAAQNTDAGVPGDGPATAVFGSSAAQPSGRPSGAKVRVVNAYLPLDGAPGPIDIYPHAWATDADKPLLSVGFGEVSEYFDPTVADDQGDMFLSFYWSGARGNGEALISKTETLKGGEVLTYFIVTGSETQPSGRRFAALQAFFQGQSLVPFGVDADTAGKSLLVVTSVGIDRVVSDANDSSYFFSLGDGCTKALGDDDFALTAVGPGTEGVFMLDPGSYTGAIHAHAHDNFDAPACDDAPLIGGLNFTAAADQTAVLFLFASGPSEFRTLFLPLDG